MTVPSRRASNAFIGSPIERLEEGLDSAARLPHPVGEGVARALEVARGVGQPRDDHRRKQRGLEIADMRTGKLFHGKDDPAQRRVEGSRQTGSSSRHDHIAFGDLRPPGGQPFIDLPEYGAGHLDSGPFPSDDAAAQRHDEAGHDLDEQDAEA